MTTGAAAGSAATAALAVSTAATLRFFPASGSVAAAGFALAA